MPTTDGSLRFRRISKNEDRNKTKKHLKPLVNELLKSRKKPKVLVIDDWVAGGRTQELTKELFYELGRGKVNVKFGVLVGGNADVSGSMARTSGFIDFVEWHDNPYIIGVDYRNGSLKPVILNSGEDVNYRKEMYKNIRKFAKSVKERVQDKIESRFGKLVSAFR